MITRSDLNPGYQIAQSGHAISQFFLEHPDLAKQWNNNYLISLSVSSEKKLESLLTKLIDKDVKTSYFIEPDIGDQLTSICFLATDETDKLTSSLPLSLKSFNN